MKSAIDRSAIDDMLRLISTALATAKLYSIDHEQVKLQLPRIHNCLTGLLNQQQELTFMVVKNELLFDGTPLQQSLQSERIARSLNQRNISFFSFFQGLGATEVQLFIEVISGHQHTHLLDSGAPHINYGEVDVKEDPDSPLAITRFADLSREEINSIESLYHKIGNKDNIEMNQVAAIIAGFVTAFQQECNPLLALVPLKTEDDYTFTHSINVAILNIAQAQSLGLSNDLLHDVGVAGMLHDAGKIFVDKEIIRHPEQLTDEQWREMKKHPMRGAQYLMGQEGIPQLAILTAFEHHMRYDRQGYPAPPPGWQLNICSQITMVSDTFDALRTRRTYKEPWDFPEICGLMTKLAGKQLNPHLTLNFLKLLKDSGDEIIDNGLELSAEAPPRSAEDLSRRHVCE
ncbi:MAG: HD domain-containing protein [Pelovirga sp.]